MKQVLQNLRSGRTELAEVPAPSIGRGDLLIQTRASLISAGTERMLVEFSQASLIGKAKAQPDKVKQVLEKIRTDGLMPTLEAVFNRLDEPLPLGYCNAGVVLEVGRDVRGFTKGDRVISNGPHAEIVAVPQNLCARIPDGVAEEQAAFTVLSSVGLQGIRLLAPGFGEHVVVYGLGLVGLISVQLLRANGCRVLGVDVDAGRLELARRFGAAETVDARQSNPVVAAAAWSGGRGADGVLVTASAKTDEIMHNAAEMCRKRGRIVMVGAVGMNLRRSDFYEKEQTIQVSCSYGPGRYDPDYEQGGVDYPYAFVRWTEQRNFEAVLDAMSRGDLQAAELISHRMPHAEAPAAYDQLSGSALGIVLNYPQQVELKRAVQIAEPRATAAKQVTCGVIGAGNFAKVTLMPALARAGARVKYVASRGGVSAQHLASKFGVEQAVSDYRHLLDDEQVNLVLVVVRHHMHARLAREALEAGKHVFIEKPMALNTEQLSELLEASRRHPERLIMVGFNRRFSPHVERIGQLLQGRTEPLAMHMTVNAGAIPADHWVHDPEVGGGRIIGEGCHFIDLLACLAGSPIERVQAEMMGERAPIRDDRMSIVLRFADGSIGTVNYFANGSKSYPKETLEVFSEQRVLRLDNFRRVVGYGWPGFRKFKTGRQDKGHAAELATFVRRLSDGGASPIPLEQLVNSTLASFAAVTSASEGRAVDLRTEYASLGDADASVQAAPAAAGV